MPKDSEALARDIVRALIDDLAKRKGFIEVMRAVKPAVQDEHFATWVQIVETFLRQRP